MQQFRECLTGEERYRFVIHDRDAIYSKDVDLLLKMTGLRRNYETRHAHVRRALGGDVVFVSWWLCRGRTSNAFAGFFVDFEGSVVVC